MPSTRTQRILDALVLTWERAFEAADRVPLIGGYLAGIIGLAGPLVAFLAMCAPVVLLPLGYVWLEDVSPEAARIAGCAVGIIVWGFAFVAFILPMALCLLNIGCHTLGFAASAVAWIARGGVAGTEWAMLRFYGESLKQQEPNLDAAAATD